MARRRHNLDLRFRRPSLKGRRAANRCIDAGGIKELRFADHFYWKE
jgi:hypothetical protein